jgi:cytochrome c553
MLFRSFAHLLMLAFGLFVFAALGIFSIRVGLFGEGAKSALLSLWGPARDFYVENKSPVDIAVAIIGTVGSGVLAALSVYKWWHYAELNLPDRIKEHNDFWKDATEAKRVETISLLAQIGSVDLPPVPQLSWHTKIIHFVRDPDRIAAAESEEKLATLERSFTILTSSKVRCRAEIVTAQLELGSRLSGRGAKEKQRALEAFKSAVKANRTDLDALELTAKQQLDMGFSEQAIHTLDALIAAATSKNNSVRHARALRYQAEILHRSPNATEWAKARSKLIASIATLSGTDALSADNRDCELALAYGLLANVQITRERFTAAQAAVTRGENLLGLVKGPCRGWARHQLAIAKKRMVDAARDNDDPNSPD